MFFFYWTGLQDPCELCISQDLQGYRSFKSSWWQKWRWLGTRCRCTRVCPVSTLAPSLLPRFQSLKKLFVLLEEACTIHLWKETWDGEAGCGRDNGGCRWVWPLVCGCRGCAVGVDLELAHPDHHHGGCCLAKSCTDGGSTSSRQPTSGAQGARRRAE